MPGLRGRVEAAGCILYGWSGGPGQSEADDSCAYARTFDDKSEPLLFGPAVGMHVAANRASDMEATMKKALGIITFCFMAIALLGFAPLAHADDVEDITGSDLSMTQTSYQGARLLKGTENVQVGGITVGPYGDDDNNRYSYFQGDTHFGGVSNPETGNKVDIVTEWYWFESSVPRNADFYVGVIKVKSSPNVIDSWFLKEENGWYGNMMWPDDVVQLLEVKMDPSGVSGGLRWDWCVPFDTYSWEPEKNIEVASGYSAGFDVEGGFSEGGILKDLTDKSNIQAKGFIKGNHSVSTQYTITLYKWQVLVSSGADNMKWQMRVLKGGNNQDSAYHEYFVVVQAEKGTPVHIPEITIAANFKHSMWWWFDNYEAVSATITDVTFIPPPACYVDDEVPADACNGVGVCDSGAGYCDPELGEWACNYPEEHEAVELTCDGLDNDCDGDIDEGFPKLGMTCDGDDDDMLKNGIYVCSIDGTDVYCDEDPCAAKECGDGCGQCDFGYECINNHCFSLGKDDGEEDNEGPMFDCNGVTEVGQCDGNWLTYCAGGELIEQYCAFCCGFDAGNSYFDCMTQDKCEPQADDCQPKCDGKWCGPDGCGGVCGICDDGESCTDIGECVYAEDENVEYLSMCGDCPAGWICSAGGQCVPQNAKTDAGEVSNDGEAQGCTAGPMNGGRSAGLAFFMLSMLVALGFRAARKASL